MKVFSGSVGVFTMVVAVSMTIALYYVYTMSTKVKAHDLAIRHVYTALGAPYDAEISTTNDYLDTKHGHPAAQEYVPPPRGAGGYGDMMVGAGTGMHTQQHHTLPQRPPQPNQTPQYSTSAPRGALLNGPGGQPQQQNSSYEDELMSIMDSGNVTNSMRG